jgi:micrococcal nuclease
MFEGILRSFEILFLSLSIFVNSIGVEIVNIPENQVIRVIDGDTIEVYQNKKVEKIRMIGLNTPESVDPRKQVECFGIEASDRLKELIEGKIVKLETDETQDKEDRFGRKLRYVFLGDENINQKMIADGYGFEYTYKVPYKYQNEFKEAQKSARKKSLGLWDTNNCDY